MKQSLQRHKFKIRGINRTLITFVLLIIMYAAFSSTYAWVSFSNYNMLRSMSIYLLVGIGQSYVMITGNIDLSIGSVVGMSAMISATLMSKGIMSAPLAILTTIVCCLVVGLINGFLVGKFKLPPFISTLGTMFVARGVAYLVNNNRNTDHIAGLVIDGNYQGIGKEVADKFQNLLYHGKTIGVFNTFLIAMAIFAFFFFILSKTKTGRHMYAVGSNIDAAWLSGINVHSTVTKAYIVSSLCACVVGLILVAQAAMGIMEAGIYYEMYGVTAGVIGGISPFGGMGSLLGTLAGAASWRTLENGLSIVGVNFAIQRIVVGTIVIFAALLDVGSHRGASKVRLARKSR